MQKRLLVGLIMAVITLAGLFSTLGVILPPSTKTFMLLWDYPLVSSEIIFNVYGTTNLSEPMNKWSLITNVASTSCVLPMRYGSEFFTVAASNTTTHLQSDFAGK